ncbi:ferritin heavy chain [Halyomorpha halys]|uniref:ferritin heavy chain n=1 Tax=Halyomorpha halys TaxID=286706 RepID=UPI0006D52824|nr:ferritin subunit [Halyomorpha halys]
MKVFVFFLGLMACLYSVNADSCKLLNSMAKLSDMVDACSESIRGQIQKEIDASMHYLLMGAHFSQDRVNRPGFAKFFFHAASEEREHAYKLMQYLLMRGHMRQNLLETIQLKNVTTETKPWANGLEALNKALELEKYVTESILNIMVVCEQAKEKNDYHAVDYLINEFLDEQYKGQRDLAGKISELNRMEHAQGSLGEFLFDKKLLKEA